ncbi:MAG: transcriptional regulator, AraC family [Mucilaginibacter sp.]|nr:transcriptional regulator, AraC family [Mucilaginibacter sp.]
MMKTENLYPPYEISFQELEECPKSAHKHNFFELVYIVSGSGKQCINSNTYKYKPGQMFLITPLDCHAFDVETITNFAFIRFNDIYIRSQSKEDRKDKERIKRLEFILHNASHQPGCILTDPGDKVLVKALVHSMATELINRNTYHQEIIDQLVNTVITIIARNISLKLPERIDENSEPAAINLINYIQEHIYSPELLRADVISSKLGMSESYLGRYFKKQIGESMQHYITKYKVKLVENRLRHSSMRINEIVMELGFTDESHLNRLFKKYNGVNPTSYRKLHQTKAAS